jgi:excisionase family DNA binding protein
MAIGKEDFEAGVYGDDLHLVMQRLPYEQALEGRDVQHITGLATKSLNRALPELVRMGYLREKEINGTKYYLKVASAQPQEWYSIDEAAKYLRVSRRTVYQLVQERQMVSYRVGNAGHRRFRREDLERVMRREEVPAADAINGAEDPVLAELWDNEKDAEYDRI